MKPSFEQTLNYSSVNEDWDAELTALEARSGDVVLCITGSGVRPLAVLARTGAEVVAVDVNAAQNNLLRLQIAAIEVLGATDFLRWIGLDEAEPGWRLATYRHRLARRLPPSARAWWDAHRQKLARGVLYAGRWERHFRRVSSVVRRIWPVEELFRFADLQRQRRWLGEHWDSLAWRAAWWIVCDPRLSRLALGDPAFHGRLSVDPRRYLHARMRLCLDACLARESSVASLVLTGRLSLHDLPPHLTAEGLAVIRERLDRLTVVDRDVTGHLREIGQGRYSRFSLSDVPSFLDAGGFASLCRTVAWAARPGSRVVIREFLRRHPVPPELPLRRERSLERKLALSDRSFAYDFIIAVRAGEGP